MSDSGQNVNNIKYSNRSLLLNLLYFGGTQSRKALAKNSHLTAAAITMIISELIEEKAVIQTEKIAANGRLGRNEQLLDLNYKALYAIGIHIGTGTFEINLTSLDSKILSSRQFNLSLIEGNLFGTGLQKIINNLISEFSIPIQFVIGIGVSIRGIVDSENGISVNSYNLFSNDLNIKYLLYEALGLPVVVDNNVRSMLRADIILRHAQPAQSTLLLKYGPGVGGALLIGQKSFPGASCNAVELGHVCVQHDGDNCICGKRGCLETVVSYNAIFRKTEELFSLEKTPALFSLCEADIKKLSIKNILLAYEKNDAGVENIFRDIIKYIGISVSNFASLFDPEIVLLVSDVFICKKFSNNLQNEILTFRGKNKPKYIIISDSRKLEKYGATSIVINNFLESGAQYLRDTRLNRTEV